MRTFQKAAGCDLKIRRGPTVLEKNQGELKFFIS